MPQVHNPVADDATSTSSSDAADSRPGDRRERDSSETADLLLLLSSNSGKPEKRRHTSSESSDDSGGHTSQSQLSDASTVTSPKIHQRRRPVQRPAGEQKAPNWLDSSLSPAEIRAGAAAAGSLEAVSESHRKQGIVERSLEGFASLDETYAHYRPVAALKRAQAAATAAAAGGGDHVPTPEQSSRKRSKYTGVRWHALSRKWRAGIGQQGRAFDREEDAAAYWDVCARAMGRKNLNFDKSHKRPPRSPATPTSKPSAVTEHRQEHQKMHPADIQFVLSSVPPDKRPCFQPQSNIGQHRRSLACPEFSALESMASKESPPVRDDPMPRTLLPDMHMV